MLRRAGISGFLLAFGGLLVVGALVIGGCAYSGYNRAVALDQSVKAQWAQVDTVLQRRLDLIPNLVETVKGYASHEKDIFTDIANARTKYFAAGNQDDKVQAASGMERALARLLVLRETYPELKAQASFQDLMTQLEGSENRVAVERKRYNEAVQELNTYVKGPLGHIFAGWAGVKEASYFEAPQAAREAPKVDFGKSSK